MNMPFKLFYPEDSGQMAGSLGGSKDGLSESKTANNPFDPAPSGGGRQASAPTPPQLRQAAIPPQLVSPNPDRPANPMDAAEIDMRSLPTRVGEETPAPETLQTPQEPPAQQPVQSSVQGLTAEQIAEVVAKTAERFGAPPPRQPEPQQQREPELTPQQFNERFGVVQVDEKQYEAMFGFKPENPAQIAALNEFGQGLVRQTMKLMGFLQQQQLGRLEQKLSSQLTPIVQSQQSAENARLKQEFYKVNPDLADYDPLVMEIIGNLERDEAGRKQQGLQSRFSGSRDQQIKQAYEYVASETRRLGRLSAPNGGPQGQPQTTQQQQPAQQSTRRMAPLSQGGQTSGSNGATQSKISDAQFVFG